MKKYLFYAIIILIMQQSCCILFNNCENNTELKEKDTLLEFENKLRNTLEKLPRAPIVERRLVSKHLFALRRVLMGKIETTFEKKIDSVWNANSVTEVVKQTLIKRITIFSNMPAYLQLKVVDSLYLYARNDFPYTFTDTYIESENAGIICSQSTRKTCNPTFLGKLTIPEPSQSIAIEKTRPIAGIANGKTGLLLINISTPTNPTYFSTPYSAYKSANTAFVNDVILETIQETNYAIITSNRENENIGCFEIVDITTPLTPIQKSKIIGAYKSITLSNNKKWAFTFNQTNNKIDIINMTDIGQPYVCNTITETDNVVNLTFGNNLLAVTKDNGDVTIYSVNDNNTDTPNILWVWGGNVSSCPVNTIDNICKSLIRENQFYFVRDGGFKTWLFNSENNINWCDNLRHNSAVFSENGIFIIDRIQDNISETCLRLPYIDFFRLDISRDPIKTITIPNEINGMASLKDKLYIADYIKSECDKVPSEELSFRIYALPITNESYNDISPTINTINGQIVTREDLQELTCVDSRRILCTSDLECGETGECVGGVCAQLPTFDVTNGSELILNGKNYWDVNAQVLIQNLPQTTWIPVEALVHGDSYCDLDDKITIKLDNSVTTTGRKKIKIRNYNTDPKKYICFDCRNPNDPNCTPEYVDSKEVTVYFNNSTPNTGNGYDLRIVYIKVLKGSGGCGDLGCEGFAFPDFWNSCACGDDEIFMISKAPNDEIPVYSPSENDFWKFKNKSETIDVSTLISRATTDGPDPITQPVINLLEIDKTQILGGILLSLGTGCISTVSQTSICGPATPYCAIGCGTVAFVGFLLVILDGNEFIIGEDPMGLALTKSLSQQILLYGEPCIPQEWKFSKTTFSNNILYSVGDLIEYGGKKYRNITKIYSSLTSDAVYEIQFRLSEN